MVKPERCLRINNTATVDCLPNVLPKDGFLDGSEVINCNLVIVAPVDSEKFGDLTEDCVVSADVKFDELDVTTEASMLLVVAEVFASGFTLVPLSIDANSGRLQKSVLQQQIRVFFTFLHSPG
ncbi:unnamed protein product [Enterobius vermicularis]|uniref:ZP domain-containing protein n=1 Tax=Enterobius vermicularis TaxID=51028 RepID=A0A0N4USQ1_ENTVE|nr:unnamed protein product [Enterobius vermicularis]